MHMMHISGAIASQQQTVEKKSMHSVGSAGLKQTTLQHCAAWALHKLDITEQLLAVKSKCVF